MGNNEDTGKEIGTRGIRNGTDVPAPKRPNVLVSALRGASNGLPRWARHPQEGDPASDMVHTSSNGKAGKGGSQGHRGRCAHRMPPRSHCCSGHSRHRQNDRLKGGVGAGEAGECNVRGRPQEIPVATQRKQKEQGPPHPLHFMPRSMAARGNKTLSLFPSSMHTTQKDKRGKKDGTVKLYTQKKERR